MKVTIWDLDYYYSSTKVNCFNPDVMRLSSYHKQRGDDVNFVLSPDDIFRPFDLYYIIKENKKTPNPPLQFFTDSRVKWWGNAVKQRVNWKMNAGMIACRPDYLLYPEKETKMERSDQIRLFGPDGKFVERRQNWENAYTSKHTLVVDENWAANDRAEVVKAIIWLQQIENVSFLYPISLIPFIQDKSLTEQFLKLKFHKGSIIKWGAIYVGYAQDAIDWLADFYRIVKNVKREPLVIKIYWDSHWSSRETALLDFKNIRQLVVLGKRKEVIVTVQEPEKRLDTPYFLFFEEVAKWMNKSPRISWLEWITLKYSGKFVEHQEYWNSPQKWNEVFRDLLRQTYQDVEFLLLQWGNKSISENAVPWLMWQEQFKIGL